MRPDAFRQFVKENLSSIYAHVASQICSKNLKKYSSVLVPFSINDKDEILLMLNKRSRRVPQPGDLCFPGGTLELPKDNVLGFIFPFLKSSFFKTKTNRFLISTLMATAIRESWEEIRLNPLSIEFLGVLPPQRLIMFKKLIVSFVCWIRKPGALKPNQEVEKIVWIPLKSFYNLDNYAVYRLYGLPDEPYRDFPCFLFQDSLSVEILWGATYRIVTEFLINILKMNLPIVNINNLEKLHIVPGVYDPNYLTGYEISQR